MGRVPGQPRTTSFAETEGHTCTTSACDCTALWLTCGNGGGLADGACVLGGGGARLIAEVAKEAHIQQRLLLSYNKQFRFRLRQRVLLLFHQDASTARTRRAT